MTIMVNRGRVEKMCPPSLSSSPPLVCKASEENAYCLMHMASPNVASAHYKILCNSFTTNPCFVYVRSSYNP